MEFKSSAHAIKQHILLFSITLVFSIAFLGGGGYLLFKTQNDINALNKLVSDTQQETADSKAFSEIVPVAVKTGWFAHVANYDRFLAIVNQLYTLPYQLDAGFVSDSTTWFTQSIAQLNTEKEQIAGFTIQDEFVANQQHSLLAFYETQIRLLTQTSALITDWDKPTTGDRKAKLDSIDRAFLAMSSAYSRVAVRAMRPPDGAGTAKPAELAQKITEYQASIDQLQTREILATAAIAIGVVALVFLIASVRRWHSPPEVVFTFNSNRSREQTNLRNRRY